MITNDINTSNTLATEILLALDELQAQLEANGLEQFVTESRLSDSPQGYAICWRNGALHTVDAVPYEEFNAAEGIVIGGLDSRKHITFPDLYSHPQGGLEDELVCLREFWSYVLADENPTAVASLIAFGKLPASTRQILKVDTKRLIWDVTNRDILEDERSEDFLELLQDALLEVFQPLIERELTHGQIHVLAQEMSDRFDLFAYELDHLVEWVAARYSISPELQLAHDRLVKALR